MKSAQVAWTEAVNNYLGKRIHIDPAPILMMFSADKAAKKFSEQKFRPMIEATPELRERVDLTGARKNGNRWNYWNFPGGFLELVGSNSPIGLKSTPAPVVIIEEPADAADNVRDQGDSIALIRERTKTFARWKVILGGTPKHKGLCPVEAQWLRSDQRKYFVPCHHCGEHHVLSFDNLTCLEEGRAETAQYVCPRCGSLWTDREKNANVQRGEWRATAQSEVAGFWINELYSPFPGSTFERLMARYIEAKTEADQGRVDKLVVYWNSARGEPYEWRSDAPDVATLRERAENYKPLTIPHGALVLTAGVDVQHNRLAIKIVGWGRDEESWLIYYDEYEGTCTDWSDPVWEELHERLYTPIRHASGAMLRVSAVSIDSSDGHTNDNVYRWVRRRQRFGAMAVKGDAWERGSDRQIFSRPKPVDLRGETKASRYGLQIYMVGTNAAKDLIDARMKLRGTGPGRMHWYDAGEAYFEQMTAEVKAPSRNARGRLVWQKKPGKPNEALDCEVYALHAARRLKLHRKSSAWWDALERKLLQPDLLSGAEPQSSSEPAATELTPPDPPLGRRRTGARSKGGFVGRWRN